MAKLNLGDWQKYEIEEVGSHTNWGEIRLKVKDINEINKIQYETSIPKGVKIGSLDMNLSTTLITSADRKWAYQIDKAEYLVVPYEIEIRSDGKHKYLSYTDRDDHIIAENILTVIKNINHKCKIVTAETYHREMSIQSGSKELYLNIRNLLKTNNAENKEIAVKLLTMACWLDCPMFLVFLYYEFRQFFHESRVEIDSFDDIIKAIFKDDIRTYNLNQIQSKFAIFKPKEEDFLLVFDLFLKEELLKHLKGKISDYFSNSHFSVNLNIQLDAKEYFKYLLKYPVDSSDDYYEDEINKLEEKAGEPKINVKYEII